MAATLSSVDDDDDNASGIDAVHKSAAPPPQPMPTDVHRRLIGRRLLQRLLPHLPDAIDSPANYWLPYCVIFASGVGCSLVLMILLNTFVGGGGTAPAVHTLPAGHFLQVRDEFQVRFLAV